MAFGLSVCRGPANVNVNVNVDCLLQSQSQTTSDARQPKAQAPSKQGLSWVVEPSSRIVDKRERVH